MSRGRWLLLAMFGCADQAEIALPSAGDHTAGILILIGPDEAPFAWAFDPARESPRFTTIDGTRAAVAHYRLRLEALGLAPGRVTILDAPEGRGLAPYSELLVAELDATPSWTPVDSLPKPYDEIRFPVITPETCAERGGCYADEEAAAALACSTPCPFDRSIDEPAMVMIPASPDLSPCPTGWSPAEGTCDPPEVAVPCGPGEVRFVDEVACHPIGSPCPGDGLPANAPAGAIYVRSGSTGNGTRAAPFGTIAEALAMVPPRGAIAIGVGRYAEPVTFDTGHIIGACASGVEIAGVVDVSGESILEDLSFGVDPVITDGVTDLHDVILRGALSVHGEILARRILAAGPAAELIVEIGGDATFSRITVEGGRLHARGRASIEDARFSSCSGICILIDQADVSLKRSLVEGSTNRGISAERSIVDLEDVVVRDTSDGFIPAGVYVVTSTITARRVSVSRAYEHGIRADQSDALLEDIVIRDIGRSIEPTTLPRTVSFFSSSATIRRALIERPTAIGIEVSGSSDVLIEDVKVRDVATDSVYIIDEVSPDAEGVVIREGSTARLLRASVEKAHLGFLFYAGVDASDLSAKDLEAIRDPETGQRYTGIGLRFVGGRSTVMRAHVVNAARQSVDADRPNAEAVITDVVVEGPTGRAFRAHRLGRLDLDRVRISGTQAGICGELESRIIVRNLLVEDSVGDADPCPGNQVTPGVNLSIEPQGHLEISKFRIDGGTGPALLVSNEGSYELRDGVIARHPVGVLVDLNPASFPLESFMVRVRYEDIPDVFAQ